MNPCTVPLVASDDAEPPCRFSPPLYTQRHQLVQATLRRHNCRRVVEAGCGEGAVLHYVSQSNLQARSLEYVAGLDMDATALERAARLLKVAENSPVRGALKPLVVELFLADLCCLPPPPPSPPAAQSLIDAVIAIEVLEHVHPERVAAFTDTVFAQLGALRGARLVLLTTPNRDANVRCHLADSLHSNHHHHASSEGAAHECSVYSHATGQPWRRHLDHKFELTAAQFRRYCDHVLDAFAPYWARYELVGLEDDFTQGAVFFADPAPTPALDQSQENSHLFPSSPVAWRHSREARLASFPFESVFGLDWATYKQRYRTTTTTTRATVHDAEVYTRVACVTRASTPLWTRLGSCAHQSLREALETAEVEPRTAAQSTRPAGKSNRKQIKTKHIDVSPSAPAIHTAATTTRAVTVDAAHAQNSGWTTSGLWLASPCAVRICVRQQRHDWADRAHTARAAWERFCHRHRSLEPSLPATTTSNSVTSRATRLPASADTAHALERLSGAESKTGRTRLRRFTTAELRCDIFEWLSRVVDAALPDVAVAECAASRDDDDCDDDDDSPSSDYISEALQRVLLFLALADTLPSASAWLDAHRSEIRNILHPRATKHPRRSPHPTNVGDGALAPSRNTEHQELDSRACQEFARLFGNFSFSG